MYNQSRPTLTPNGCMYNTTNTSQLVCVIGSKNQSQYPYLPDYRMDISIFSYMYTLFLAFGCYSILNPASARVFAINTIFNLAKASITGYSFFKDRIYRPYMKHMHPKLLRLLNIDDGINEIVVIKNGKTIHSFKTMELFVKNNPIPFVKEFSDDEHEEDQDQHQDQDQDQDQDQHQDQDQEHINPPHLNQDSYLSDKVDYNKKCDQLTDLIEAFKSHSLDDMPSASDTSASDTSASAPASETNDLEESVETSETSETSDDIPDDYILDPNAYDFIIRNFYYEDEKTGETHSYVFKYDIFYKSEIVEKYDIEMIKDKYFSTRKFIGISLKTNGEKYSINLTSPSNYYVSDNSILNYSFMKWYMMKHYHVNLSRNYIISCIDNYVEMYRIHPGKKIIVHKNRFEIVNDETFMNDNDKDKDKDKDNNNLCDTHSESDTDSETPITYMQNTSETGTDNINLEEGHEMCDIEILEYD